MEKISPALTSNTPQEEGSQKKKKPSACKMPIRPFDQRTLEGWVR